MKNLILAIAAVAFTIPTSGWSATIHKTQPTQKVVIVKEPRQRLGTLSCEVAGGVGMVIGSNRAINCRFRQQGGWVEHYAGSIGKLGLDIGVSGKSYLSWVVVNTKPTRVGEEISPVRMSVRPRTRQSVLALVLMLSSGVMPKTLRFNLSADRPEQG
jgi:hypothetical protein